MNIFKAWKRLLVPKYEKKTAKSIKFLKFAKWNVAVGFING